MSARSVWILPPHRDFTLTARAPEGFALLDLQARFAARLLTPDAVAAAADREGLDPVRKVELLACAQVLRRPPAAVHAQLRARGAALRALTEQTSVRLTLDDVQLEQGSTERSADLLAHAAAAPERSPWAEELEAAVAAAAAADRLRVTLDCDQRLPFVFALVGRLPGRPLELCGQFALRHREVLAALPGFERCAFSADELAFELELAGARVQWVWDGGAPPPGAWAGYVGLERLGALPEGAKVVVAPFAALEPERVLGIDGRWYPLERLRAGLVPVVGEWHFGAPAVDADRAAQTAALLSDHPLYHWLGGLRRFHRGAHLPPEAEFAGEPLLLGAREADRDLSRSVPVLEPEAMDEGGLHLLAGATLGALSRGPTPPSPGRVALGMASVPRKGGAGHLQLAADAAVVQLATQLDGRPGSCAVAVSLRTGAMLQLDGRLLPLLSGLATSQPTDSALSTLPALAREKLSRTLLQRRILEEVAP